MTDENINTTEEKIDTTVTAVSTDSPTQSIEDLARADGWVPLDEFKGNPDNWADAKEFVRVGKIIKARDEKANKLDKELKELKAITKTMLATMQKQEVVAYEKAAKDLEARLARAKEIGDVEEALDVSRRQQELHTQVQQQHVSQTKSLAETEEFLEFHPANKWVTGTDRKSKAMQSVASDISNEFSKANPHASLKDELNHIAVEMRKEFPEYFKEEAKKTVSAVLSGNSTKPVGEVSSDAGLSAGEKTIINYLKKQGYDYKAYSKLLGKS
jgi:hypothetical protein